MLKKNYSLLTQAVIDKVSRKEERPSLLLHVCCAPCSSSVLEYLYQHFDITLYYYNPNISPLDEYIFRLDELKRFLSEAPFGKDIKLVAEEYEPEMFAEISKGLEKLEEGGERCFKCYWLRLEKSANYAKENGFDYFTTTLSVSPYKNAEKLNSIGEELANRFGVEYLFSDFKKKDGYKRSIELSREYGLYRQDYCGCIFSKAASEAARLEKNS